MLFQASPAGITVDYDQTDLHVLPLWANMQLMGPEKLSGILHANANLVTSAFIT